MRRRAQWIVLLLFLTSCLGAAWIGSALTVLEIHGWYQSLTKPEWNPPDRVFGPVWATLFILMAVAGWLHWRSGSFNQTRLGLFLFFTQLTLNVLWSTLFFRLHQPGWAFVEILCLWTMILFTLIEFYRHNRTAGTLLIPDPLRVSFAAVLNLTIWQLSASPPPAITLHPTTVSERADLRICRC